MKLSIDFPALPYKELTPNFKRANHWAKYSGIAKIARLEARTEAYASYPSLRCPTPISVRYRLILWLPAGRQAPDEDNLVGWVKHYIDGLADHFSGGNDKNWSYAGHEIGQAHESDREGMFTIELEID